MQDCKDGIYLNVFHLFNGFLSVLLVADIEIILIVFSSKITNQNWY